MFIIRKYSVTPCLYYVLATNTWTANAAEATEFDTKRKALAEVKFRLQGKGIFDADVCPLAYALAHPEA